MTRKSATALSLIVLASLFGPACSKIWGFDEAKPRAAGGSSSTGGSATSARGGAGGVSSRGGSGGTVAVPVAGEGGVDTAATGGKVEAGGDAGQGGLLPSAGDTGAGGTVPLGTGGTPGSGGSGAVLPCKLGVSTLPCTLG